MAAVFKLHGSVNWVRGLNSLSKRDDAIALTCHDNELALATPGPTKPEEISGTLARLWTRAVAELAQADAIVLMGYRFRQQMPGRGSIYLAPFVLTLAGIWTFT